MTIIHPHKKKFFLQFLVTLFCMIAVCGGVYVVQYSALANVRHEITVMKNNLAEVHVTNAELKNKLYTMIDPVALESLVPRFALTLDMRPEYLNLAQ